MAQTTKNLRAPKTNPLKKTSYVADQQLSNPSPVKPMNATTKSAKAFTKTPFASSGNILTAITGQSHCLSYDRDLSTAMFVCRGGGSFGYTSNQVVASWTSDNGTSFNNMRVCNIDDATHSNRYPTGSIFNPAGNTNVNNAFVAYEGTSHNNGTWDHDYFGSMRLDSTYCDYLYAPLDSPRYHEFTMYSFSSNADGKVYALGGGDDQAGSPRLFTGMSVWQGTFNTGSNSFDWNETRLACNMLNDATGEDDFAGTNSLFMAWSDDGATGYVFTVGIDTTGSAYNFNNSIYPIVYKSTDHGTTWNRTAAFDFRTIPAIQTKLNDWWVNTVGNTGTPRAWFKRENEYRESVYDAVVDKNNNLHILTLVQCGYSNHPDSVFTSFAYEPMVLFDVFTTATGWDAVIVDTLLTSAVDDASGLGGTQGWDHRGQMSVSPDGDNIFYVWVDSDTTFFDMVLSPDIFIRQYNVTGDVMSGRIPITRGTAYDGDNHWMFVANKCFETTPGTWEIPITTTTHGSADTDPCTHYYFSGVQVTGIKDHNQSTDTWVTQNYPNPFNGTTTVSVNLSKSCNLSLEVTNITGQKMMQIDKGKVNSGSHSIVIDGSKLTSGIYFYTVRAGENSVTRKMIVE